MQHELRASVDLLDGNGVPVEEGWARRPYWRYDRFRVRGGPLRIKEWDYYAILSADKGFGVTLTMSDLGYAGLCALCFLDLERRTATQVDSLAILPLGRTGLPPAPLEGAASVLGKKLSLGFRAGGGTRVVEFDAPDFPAPDGGRGLAGRVELEQAAGLESMNIVTSWAEDRRSFYCNTKVNCLPASGGCTLGGRSYAFDPMSDFGVLDWGRGRWTYRNRWYWGSASGLADGKRFGFNLGYGFSDRSPASENALMYDGVVHKLEDVTFHIPPGDYTAPWRFSSSDGRFEMDFRPLVDRHSDMNLGVIRSTQHQVFGLYSGRAVLDDGRALEVRDFLGFAEDVYNRW
ncbi:MAG: DUF2804 domain-containing protein [Spirochaetia bacterium]|nr:DUF2804 domain-containing protein [Spirochaetia bacterium]